MKIPLACQAKDHLETTSLRFLSCLVSAATGPQVTSRMTAAVTNRIFMFIAFYTSWKLSFNIQHGIPSAETIVRRCLRVRVREPHSAVNQKQILMPAIREGKGYAPPAVLVGAVESVSFTVPAAETSDDGHGLCSRGMDSQRNPPCVHYRSRIPRAACEKNEQQWRQNCDNTRLRTSHHLSLPRLSLRLTDGRICLIL